MIISKYILYLINIISSNLFISSGFNKFFKSKGSRLYSILMSGEIIVSVVFIEALVISIFLLVIPLVAFTQKKKKPLKSNIFFFLSVGAGFIFLELFFIKKYIFLFGNPTVSFAIVVSEILVFSSIGGFFSQRISPKHFRSILISLIFVLILILASFDSIIYYILGLSSVSRFLLASLLLFPAGFLVGLPFSLGMRYLLKSPVERAYAWSANGCTSVLASILSAQIAISSGISIILICSVLSYILAFLCILKHDVLSASY